MPMPTAVIDMDIVRRAASIGCTLGEIAVLCGVHRHTFKIHCDADEALREAIEEGRERGKASLRRMQWQLAESGNPTMQIWLGKQHLGQSDKATVSGDPDAPLTYVIRAPTPIEDAREWLKTYSPKGSFDESDIVEG